MKLIIATIKRFAREEVRETQTTIGVLGKIDGDKIFTRDVNCALRVRTDETSDGAI